MFDKLRGFINLRKSTKQPASIKALACELVNNFEEVDAKIKNLEDLNIEQEKSAAVFRELTMAYIFVWTHVIETLQLNSSIAERFLNEVHMAAYSHLESKYPNFNGPDYEETLRKRYAEFREIMKKYYKDDNVFYLLCESITRKIWPEEYKSKAAFTLSISLWLAILIVHNKKALDKIAAGFELG